MFSASLRPGALVLVLLGVLVGSCEEGGEILGPAVTSIQISVSSGSLEMGAILQLSAEAYGPDGNTVAGISINWMSEDEAVATVSAQGRVSALAPGQTRVAAFARGQSAFATITVVPEAEPEPPVIVTDSNLPAATAGEAYETPLEALGGEPPYTWSLRSGVLPEGIELEGSGILSGVPTSQGEFQVTIRVTDAAALFTERGFSFQVEPEPPPPSITTETLPNGALGEGYSAQLEATGGEAPYRWSVSTGALPTGLGLESGSGRITGTPLEVGTSDFTIRVEGDDGRTSTRDFQVSVNEGGTPPTITTFSLPEGRTGEAYSAQVSASGGEPPYSWSVNSGSLPKGLTLSGETGIISGVPVESDTWDFRIQVEGSDGLASGRNLSIVISTGQGEAPSIITSTLPEGVQGNSYSAQLEASGGRTPYSWSVTFGSLPGGLTLSGSDGQISGTPSSVGTSGFTIQVAGDDGRTSNRDLSISISQDGGSILTITTTSLPNGVEGESYSAQLQASGGVTPYSWSVASGSLPGGLTLSSSTGRITGTPNAQGAFNFTARVTDTDGASHTRSLSITIADLVTLVVMKGGDGVGTVVSDPAGIEIPAQEPVGEASADFPRGTTVTLHVLDSVGYWGPQCRDSGIESLGDPPCSIDLLQTDTVRVIGSYLDFLPVLSVHGGGSVTGNLAYVPNASYQWYDESLGVVADDTWIRVNEERVVTSTPDEGWRLREWTHYGCENSQESCVIVPRWNWPGVELPVRAVFEPIPQGGQTPDSLWPRFDGNHVVEMAAQEGMNPESENLTFNGHTPLSALPMTVEGAPSWLSVSAGAGAGDSDVVTFSASSASLSQGTYQATVRLWSWKSLELFTDVTVTLQVTP